jgi:CubicO group peptidase (beta-lactamase class C family)
MVHGSVAPGWEPVAEVFRENFARRGEVGAAVCMMHEGRVVVDLWGGESAPGVAWKEDTLTLVFSVTKGLASIAFLVLADRGGLEYDAPVAKYWPEFRRNFGETSVRTLLNHRAGTSILDTPLSLKDFHDPERVSRALEAQRPTWNPGEHQGYGATVWGMYAGELFRRAAGESIGQFLRREIAEPIDAEVWLGMPPEHDHRVSTLIPVPLRDRLLRQVPAMLGRSADGRVFRKVAFARKSDTWRAFKNPADVGPSGMATFNQPEVRRPELPWCNAVATARGIARVYAALGDPVAGVRLVSAATVAPLRERQSNGFDRVMCREFGFSQGFMKDDPALFSPNPATFGHPGTGGSVGLYDPDRRLAVGYTMNRMDWRIRSPRALELCRAAYRCG